MCAQIVRMDLEYGIKHFHCAICGSTLVDGEAGITDEFCQHVVVLVDWVQQVMLGNGAAPELEQEIEAATENADIVEALGKILGDTVVVFEFTEPGRGGGHVASSIVVALDFADDTDNDEED